MFKPIKNQVSFPKNEEEILSFWNKNKIFEKSKNNRKGNDEYIFYDGPPFATGKPHYGHLLAGTIKDVIPRYQTMKGRFVPRTFGWDCHGLPIEALAQEALGLSGTSAILEKGVDKFNEQCKSMVMTYVKDWENTVNRMGRWVDFSNGYKTMDKTFMETIWWVFKQLWNQNRVYRSYRIMPYSWKLNTPLSNFEAGSNYKDVQDPAVTVRVKLKTFDRTIAEDSENAYLLIWTTTPWTLPANLAIAVGPEIDYVVIKDKNDSSIYIMAKARLGSYYKDEKDYEVCSYIKGKDCLAWTYHPIFPFFKDSKNAFQILNGSFVTTEDGTGLVHCAPAYGEDDFAICKSAKITIVDTLDENCCFTNLTPEFEGLFCKEADKKIISLLKKTKKLVKHSTITHSYPFCERTDTPLIYRAIDAWYVKVEDLHDRLSKNNETISWLPKYVGEKRFGNWIKNAKDWNISRNRFWGSCIPVWVCEDDKNDTICIGSIDELEKLSGQRVDDLHKHTLDKVIIKKDNKIYKRTPEVLDCWFESGSMPYAQHHYPFENKDKLDTFFPADFIAEGLDQTRGWFYTLLVLGTALFDKSPYKNVIVNGLILAEDGHKMSKRKKNYPDTSYIFDAYGADALRLFLLGSPVVRGENLKFTELSVKEILKGVMIPIWNAYSFFVTYANVDKWSPSAATAPPDNPDNPLDRWILSSLMQMVEEITEKMNNYQLQPAANRFEQFIDDLTNWYIRRSRRRFWKSQNDLDKDNAYKTLHYVLITFAKTAAPFIPFITESIFRNLRTKDMPESVHLCDFPTINKKLRDPELENKMSYTMSAVSLGRYLRSQNSIRLRQPLLEAIIVSKNKDIRTALLDMQNVISEELNVKKVTINDNEESLVQFKAKANFKILGKKLGPLMKEVASQIAQIPSHTISNIINGEHINIEYSKGIIEIGEEELIIQRIEKEGVTVANENEITLALDTRINKDLELEGIAREIISKIQNLRRDSNLDVSDRIKLMMDASGIVEEAFNVYHKYIMGEVLCSSYEFTSLDDSINIELTKKYSFKVNLKKTGGILNDEQ